MRDKTIHAARMREWRKNNLEKVRQQNRVWKRANAARISIQTKERRKIGTLGWAALRVNGLRSHSRDKGYALPDITKEQFLAAYLAHNHCCDICGVSASKLGESLALDHDHATGEVRGWLCMQCNAGIGMLKDSPVLLKAAMEYLLL